jgi:hypothetical protein
MVSRSFAPLSSSSILTELIPRQVMLMVFFRIVVKFEKCSFS